MKCSACCEGELIEKSETYTRIECEVYELTVEVSFLSCNVCGAAIIPKDVRDKFRKDMKLLKKGLYYE